MERKEAEESFEDKDKEQKNKKFDWDSIPIFVWILIAIAAFFLFKYMAISENKFVIIIGLVLLIVILYLFSKQSKPQEPPIKLWEANYLTEKELERMMDWKYIPQNTKYRIMPWANTFRSDTEGVYWSIPVMLELPYRKVNQFLEAKVMMNGPERGYVSFPKTLWLYNGTERKPQKRILGRFGQDMKEMGMLDKVLFKTGGGQQ